MPVVDKGLLIVGVDLENERVWYKMPDGVEATAPVSAWFDRARQPVASHLLAHSFAFEIGHDGVTARYDVDMDDLSAEIVLQ